MRIGKAYKDLQILCSWL